MLGICLALFLIMCAGVAHWADTRIGAPERTILARERAADARARQ
jgi:hypothetical protein